MINKDDLRSLVALAKEIIDLVAEEHSLRVHHQSIFVSASASLQLALELESGYFGSECKVAEEALASSDLGGDTDIKRHRDHCNDLLGIISGKQDHARELEEAIVDKINKITAKKKALFDKYSKLKKKIGI